MVDANLTESDASYRCGAVEIDAMHRRVLIDGVPAKLGARAFDVLVALVERRDRVVPKRELMDLVWPRLVVEENNLLVHMVALRKLLGPQAIATIPGRGYRFTMPVNGVLHGGAAESGSAQVPPPTALGNLPKAATLFGRSDDQEALEALLREHPVVTLAGAGGIGKTHLAATTAAASRLEVPDGRWWVDLASVNEADQVTTSIAAALGMQLPSRRPPSEAMAIALAGKKLLLVLDNCEHLAGELALLVGQLRARAPDARLLLTSQESLKCRDEQVYRLGPLTVPATAQLEEAAGSGAVMLFVERAHAVDPRFRLAADNVDLVIDVCRRLDGIPLAIELAAARVPLLGLSGLMARLDQVFNVLTGGARMKLRRHQTLRAAFDWSHSLLSADERTVFRRLGVFVDGFSLDLAQQVAGDEQIDQWLVLDLLGHLIDKSLLIADGDAEPRLRLLETTRAFALEQLGAAAESDAVLLRHAQALRELMAATDAKSWNLSPDERRRAVRELGNVRAAIDWAMAGSGARRLLAYELLSGCWGVWMHNGLIDEGIERMLKLWPVSGDLPTRIEADFCLALSRLVEGAGRDERWQAARRAETLYRQFGDADRLGDALLLVATIGLVRGHLREAGQALGEAETLVTEQTALRKQAALAATQGTYYRRSGDFDRAASAFRRQVELYRRVKAEIGEYLALGNLGYVQLESGDVDAAIESLRRSVDGLRRTNAPYGLGSHLGTLAIALASRGEDLATLALAREAFDRQRSVGGSMDPMLAAALHHVHRHDLQRAVLVSGFTRKALVRRENHEPCAFDLSLLLRVRERAAAEHPATMIEAWLSAGEGLTEEQAAAIAFDDAPLDELP